MSRLLRWAFKAAAVVSALFGAATCVLWATTGETASYGWAHIGASAVSCISDDGAVQLKWVSGESGPRQFGWARPRSPAEFQAVAESLTSGSPLLEEDHEYDNIGLPRFMAAGGQAYRTRLGSALPARPDFRFWYLIVPHWLVILFSVIPLALSWLISRHSRVRPRPGHCVCGYDLRATPDRCPECGAVPAKN